MVTAVRPPTTLPAFYSSYLSEEDRPRYEVALTMEGLQGEIALLRVQLGHLCHDDPHNPTMFLRLTNAIDRLTRTQRMLNKDREVQDVDSAISTVESLLSSKRASERDSRPAANRRSPVGADPRSLSHNLLKAEDSQAETAMPRVREGQSDVAQASAPVSCLNSRQTPRVCPDAMDSRPDRESMVVGASVNPAPSVHSEQPEIDEQPGNLSPCQGACPRLELGEIERASRESDQNTGVQPPIDFSTLAASLFENQNKPQFQHGDGRSKKKNKNHHRH